MQLPAVVIGFERNSDLLNNPPIVFTKESPPLKLFFRCNQKVKSIIVTEVTVKSPFITYSSQNPWNFLDMEVIMIKDDKCFSPFQLRSRLVTFLQ